MALVSSCEVSWWRSTAPGSASIAPDSAILALTRAVRASSARSSSSAGSSSSSTPYVLRRWAAKSA
ncbi:hypothetical protein ACFQ0B_15795 [Nonomuraea thailandensis]